MENQVIEINVKRKLRYYLLEAINILSIVFQIFKFYHFLERG